MNSLRKERASYQRLSGLLMILRWFILVISKFIMQQVLNTILGLTHGSNSGISSPFSRALQAVFKLAKLTSSVES